MHQSIHHRCKHRRPFSHGGEICVPFDLERKWNANNSLKVALCRLDFHCIAKFYLRRSSLLYCVLRLTSFLALCRAERKHVGAFFEANGPLALRWFSSGASNSSFRVLNVRFSCTKFLVFDKQEESTKVEGKTERKLPFLSLKQVRSYLHEDSPFV